MEIKSKIHHFLICCTIVVPNQIKKIQLSDSQTVVFFIVIRTGFEPVTRNLEDCRSIQLSYRTKV